MPAPIALFVFNRPSHTSQTLAALQRNELASDTDLFIFADGPRSRRDDETVAAVRGIITGIQGFKSVTITAREKNCGLANSIISGVSTVLETYGSLIVLEDDMITSPHFLSYMNDALTMYEHDELVACIHGYFFPVKNIALPPTFFIRGADCWGWATWRRGWKLFEPDPWKLLLRIFVTGQRKRFDLDNSYGYTRMLFSQCIGRIDSWAIRWYASTFLLNKLTLYPRYSLVRNIGMDSSGTHTREWNKDAYDTTINSERIHLTKLALIENEEARKARGQYLKKTTIPFFKKVFLMYRFSLSRMLQRFKRKQN